ncbi:MAG TPA: sugar ABC transporter permease [Kribbella sp.]|uniref:carbohydrate ABC transporter permease n=1 Tax=Kribbella sp. TaxID=1871183 RepID=UPI002D7721A5|nr:sugar ABC transporter permease [Kribbella sp.]HET6294924.1 sugar ABC transporter permease [Kribbella sp.]
MVAEATETIGNRVLTRRKRVSNPAHRNDWKLALVLIIPAAVGFVFFAAYPTIRGIYLSFTDFKILTPPVWTGLSNYRELISDSVFWHSVGVTVYFVALSVGLGLTLSLLTAVILHRLTGSNAIRGLVLMPFLISGVVAALIWQWMLDPGLGIINAAIKSVTGHSIMFLGSSEWAIPSLALISVWKSMGYNAILIFAGLQTIPDQIYEAGRIDGANEFQMFTRLTLPLLRPIMAMVMVLTVIGSFQVFDLVAVTTKGGPANASNVLPLYIYETGFGEFNFGYAVTMSMALFVMLLTITFIQMRLLRANESDTN